MDVGTFEVDDMALDEEELLAVDVDIFPLDVLDALASEEE